jgi:hypothetical protein
MLWILFVVLQGVMIVAGIRREERAGRWSWSKFAFALGFAGLECVIVVVPPMLIDMHSRYFWLLYSAGWVVAALNFVWFIIVMRRWSLKDGRTSLEAERKDHQ